MSVIKLLWVVFCIIHLISAGSYTNTFEFEGIGKNTNQLPNQKNIKITKHPKSQTVLENTNVTFNAQIWYAKGVEANAVWQKYNNKIDGSYKEFKKNTKDSYQDLSWTLRNVKKSDEGKYRLGASDQISEIDSSNFATLTVVRKTKITVHPQSQVTNEGKSVTFSISVKDGSKNKKYQWQKDTKNIPGFTKPTYHIPAVTMVHQGSYRCVITDLEQTYPSNSAQLTVNTKKVSITKNPLSQTKSVGEPVSFFITVVHGSSNKKYEWQKNTITIPNAHDSVYSISAIKPNNQGSYRCIVSDSTGYDTSTSAELTVNTKKVSITKNPSSQSKLIGDTVSFFIAVVHGSSNKKYQWQKDAISIPNALDSVYTKSAIKQSDQGSYRCIVSDSTGNDTSEFAILAVNSEIKIVNHPIDVKTNIGENAIFTVGVTGPGTITYQWQKNGQLISGETSANYEIPVVKSSDIGTYRCLITNSTSPISSNNASLSIFNTTIELTHPRGTETFYHNTTENITWNSTDNIENVSIDLSQDGGKNWMPIVQNTKNNNVYPWTIPNILSDFCRIRIQHAKDTVITDCHASFFTIQVHTPIVKKKSKSTLGYEKSLTIGPNPISRLYKGDIVFSFVPLSDIASTEIRIYDAVGNIVFTKRNTSTLSLKSFQQGIIQGLGIPHDQIKTLAKGTYLVRLFLAGTNGKREIRQAYISFKD